MTPTRPDTSPAATGVILADGTGMGPPLHRPMTEDERRGFNWACQALRLWGNQISRGGLHNANPTDPVTLRDAMAHGGHMVSACAEALALTLGRAA